MAYGYADGNRRSGDYVSSVCAALSSQNGPALAALLDVSGGAHFDSVASGLDFTKVSSPSVLGRSIIREFLGFLDDGT